MAGQDRTVGELCGSDIILNGPTSGVDWEEQ